ncbi:hypothetical protein QTG54_011811 [Skeletonema marinoi]|uniref:Uncharacterized protein n=1 Tax=Skeletonema marinoi TaxID=267567 RepID=A0AAD8Y2B3_9STRA|nr:hypothetical protein QTG54_011811 [Skeletonema marinoi]
MRGHEQSEKLRRVWVYPSILLERWKPKHSTNYGSRE